MSYVTYVSLFVSLSHHFNMLKPVFSYKIKINIKKTLTSDLNLILLNTLPGLFSCSNCLRVLLTTYCVSFTLQPNSIWLPPASLY